MNQYFDYNNQSFDQENAQQNFSPLLQNGFNFQIYKEKKEIRKVANIIGFCLLVMSALSFLLTRYILRVLTMSALSGNKVAMLFLDSSILRFIDVCLSVFIFTVPYIVIFKLFGFRISSLVKLKKPKRGDFVPFVFLGVGFCAFSNIVVSLAGSFFATFGVNYEVPQSEDPKGILGFMLTIISTAIVPPLVEEFACRGIMLGALRKYGEAFAVVSSAALFGLMHGNFQQIPFAFLVGLVLGYTTVKTGTLWPAIIIHAINNAVSVIFDYLFTPEQATLQNAVYLVYLSFALILGIIGIYLLAKRKNAFSFKKAKTESRESQKYAWLFTGITVLIFVASCIWDSLKFFI